MARELIGFEFMIVFIECLGSSIGETIIIIIRIAVQDSKRV